VKRVDLGVYLVDAAEELHVLLVAVVDRTRYVAFLPAGRFHRSELFHLPQDAAVLPSPVGYLFHGLEPLPVWLERSLNVPRQVLVLALYHAPGGGELLQHLGHALEHLRPEQLECRLVRFMQVHLASDIPSANFTTTEYQNAKKVTGTNATNAKGGDPNVAFSAYSMLVRSRMSITAVAMIPAVAPMRIFLMDFSQMNDRLSAFLGYRLVIMKPGMRRP